MGQASSGPEPPFPPVVAGPAALELVIVGPPPAPLSPELPVTPDAVLVATPTLLVLLKPIWAPATVVEFEAPFVVDPVVVPTPVPVTTADELVLPTVLGAAGMPLSGASAEFPQPTALSIPTTKSCKVRSNPTCSVYPDRPSLGR